MINLLYISDIYLEDSIYPSQVKSLLQEYRNENVKIFPIYLSSKFETSLEGDQLVLKCWKGGFIKQVMLVFLIFKYSYIKRFLKGKEINLILGRGMKGGMAGCFLKRIFFKNSVQVFNDIRGDVLDEQRGNKIKTFFLKRAEIFISKRVDHIFCVSSYLKKVIIKRTFYKHDQISVFPTIVPEEKFNFSPSVRLKFRKKLGYLDSDIVFVYSGNAAWYQNLDFVISKFFEANNFRIKLLIITSDPEEVKRILSLHQKSEIRNNISVVKVQYDEVPKYLQAGDFGILIRDNIPTNLSASPTKFGEYVNCGLNVVFNKIPSDYYYQSLSFSLNNTILEEKDDLLAFFKEVVSKPLKNVISVNTAKKIAYDQIQIFYKNLG